MFGALLLVLLGPATFTLNAPDAKAVSWAGDITGWSSPKPMTRHGDRWSITFDVQDGARTEYKFVVDGAWLLDSKNLKKEPNGLGGENSVWEGPGYRHTAKDEVPKRPMVRSEFSVESKLVPKRTVAVFVPAGSHQNLPILVFGDGRDYENLARAPKIVQNLIDEKKIRPVVLVLVPSPDRMKEYWRDSAPYSRFLVEELLPEVRRRTPASSSPKDVYLGGASLGGLISWRTAVAHPTQVAGGILSQSGAFWVDGPHPKWPVGNLAKGIRTSFDWGGFETEIRASNLSLTDALKSGEVSVVTRETPEGHNWTAWRERLEGGLVALLGTKS